MNPTQTLFGALGLSLLSACGYMSTVMGSDHFDRLSELQLNATLQIGPSQGVFRSNLFRDERGVLVPDSVTFSTGDSLILSYKDQRRVLWPDRNAHSQKIEFKDNFPAGTEYTVRYYHAKSGTDTTIQLRAPLAPKQKQFRLDSTGQAFHLQWETEADTLQLSTRVWCGTGAAAGYTVQYWANLDSLLAHNTDKTRLISHTDLPKCNGLNCQIWFLPVWSGTPTADQKCQMAWRGQIWGTKRFTKGLVSYEGGSNQWVQYVVQDTLAVPLGLGLVDAPSGNNSNHSVDWD